MKKKIYSKKTFWSGIFFSILSLFFIIMLIARFEEMNSGKIIKDGIYALLSMLIGFGSIDQSLNYKRTREAEQENDEREELVNLKSSNASIKIIQSVSWILMVITIISWYISRIDGLIGMIVAFGLIFNISLFSQMFTYIYYNKKV